MNCKTRNCLMAAVVWQAALAGCCGKTGVDAVPAADDTIAHVAQPCIVTTTVPVTSPEGVDSVMQVGVHGPDGTVRTLFAIALGGDAELLAVSSAVGAAGPVSVISMADYFQDPQVWYVVYDAGADSLTMTARLDLAPLGITTAEHRALTVDSVGADSVHLSALVPGDKARKLTLPVLPIKTDNNKIINYYEYQ